MFKKLRERIAEEANKLPVGQIAFGNNSARPLDVAGRINENSEDLFTLSDSSSVIDPHPISQQFSIAEDEDGSLSEQNTPQKKLGSNSAGPDLASNTASKDIAMIGNNNPNSRKPSVSSYIPQTDIESEADDPPTLNLDGISKEQLLTTIQILKARLCKYKNKYSEVVKAYKVTGEEKKKIEHALTENQDKSLRRIAELREQCQLEQKAKAHLEENLRLILEEKDSRISVLETQINLLKEGHTGNLQEISETAAVNEENIDSSMCMNNEAILQEKVVHLSSILKECELTISAQKEEVFKFRNERDELLKQLSVMQKASAEFSDKEMKTRSEHEEMVAELKKQLVKLEKQQEDSVMCMAETKKNMHEELELKERQLNKLREETRQLQAALENEKTAILNISAQHEERVKELQTQLEHMEKTMEEEKESLIREFSRGKAEAVALMQLESSKKVASLESEWKSKMDKQQIESKIALQEKEGLLQQHVDELCHVKETMETHMKSCEFSDEKHLVDVNPYVQMVASESQTEMFIAHVDSHVSHVEEKLSEIKLLENQIQELMEQNCSLKREMKEKITGLAEMKAILDEQNTKLVSEMKVKNSEVESLRFDLNQCVKELDGYKGKLQEEVKSSKCLLSQLERDLSSANTAELEHLHAKICQLGKEREQLKIQAQDLVANTEMKYKKELEQLNKKIKQLGCQEEVIEQLKNENCSLNTQLSESLQAGATNQSQAAIEITELRKQYEDLHNEVTCKTTIYMEKEAKLQCIIGDLKKRSSALKLVKQREAELCDELNNKQQQLEKQVECDKVLEKELQMVKCENVTLKAELDCFSSLKQEKEALDVKIDSLEHSERSLSKAIDLLKHENEALRTACNCSTCSCGKILLLKNENSSLSSKIQSYELEQSQCSNCDLLKSDINQIRDECEKKIALKEEELESKAKAAMKEFSDQLNSKSIDCEQAVTELLEKNQILEDQLQREHRLEIAALRQDIFEKDCALEEMHEHYEGILKEKDVKILEYQEGLKRLPGSSIKSSDAETVVCNEVSDWDDTWVVPEENCCDHNPSSVNKLDCEDHIQQIESMQKELTKCNSELKDLRILLRLSPPQSIHSNSNCNTSNYVPEATEFEYLRNILFEYMMGKETVTLVKVIAAVLRFTEEQTLLIVEKEKAKQPAR